MSSAHDRRNDCLAIAREAGSIAKQRFGSPGTVHAKPSGSGERSRDVVTDIDFECERAIIDRIAKLAPDSLVLAEEGGATNAAGDRIDITDAADTELWLIDPIDGTVNYASAIPHFCVSVACWQSGMPVAGAIIDPMLDEEFSFEWGNSPAAYHNDKQVTVDPELTANESIAYVGGGARKLVPLVREFRSWRRMGSAALALAWVGTGRLGAYIQLGDLNAWDHAVGAPFVLAAGGVICDHVGAEWAHPWHGTTGVIAAAPKVHATVRSTLAV